MQARCREFIADEKKARIAKAKGEWYIKRKPFVLRTNFTSYADVNRNKRRRRPVHLPYREVLKFPDLC